MSTTHSSRQRRQGRRHVDLASAALLICGLVFAVFSYRLITENGETPLLLIPSVVAMTLGAMNLTKHHAPRERR